MPSIRAHRDLTSPAYANYTNNESNNIFNHKFLMFFGNKSYVLIKITQFLFAMNYWQFFVLNVKAGLHWPYSQV